MTRPTTAIAISIAIAGLALAACSGSTGTEPTVSGSEPASAAVAAPTPVPTAGLTCTDFDMAAAHVPSRVHMLALNIGTTNDNSGNWDELYTAAGTMVALADQCAPEAVDDIDGLMADITTFRGTYQEGTDQATIDADNAAVTALAEAGIPVWETLGIATDGWENLR